MAQSSLTPAMEVIPLGFYKKWCIIPLGFYKKVVTLNPMRNVRIW